MVITVFYDRHRSVRGYFWDGQWRSQAEPFLPEMHIDSTILNEPPAAILRTLVHEAVREHGLPSVSVSDVEVTRDLAHAKVFVTALMPERSVEAVKALKELSRELRMELARRVKLRHVPELHFHYDDSVDRGERIETLLRENAADLADPEAGPGQEQ